LIAVTGIERQLHATHRHRRHRQQQQQRKPHGEPTASVRTATQTLAPWTRRLTSPASRGRRRRCRGQRRFRAMHMQRQRRQRQRHDRRPLHDRDL
jgi:hypothetical protein